MLKRLYFNKLTTIFKGGVIATGVMTMVMIATPLMGMPEMRIGNILADFLHIPVWLDWAMYFMIGTILAAIYIFIFQSRLQGRIYSKEHYTVLYHF